MSIEFDVHAAGIKWRKKAEVMYGELYDYSQVVYKNVKTPVTVICHKHGPFKMKPSRHILSTTPRGCGKCKLDKNRDNNWKERIIKAEKIHNKKYGYEKVNYRNRLEDKVIITCPQHGDFEQRFDSHLKGHECTSCKQGRWFTTEEFIEKARKKHGEKYDYSLTVYKGALYNLTIICPIHGQFAKIAGNHIGGACSGCPLCTRNSKFKFEEPTILYYFELHDPCGIFYKIGISNNVFNTRYSRWERDSMKVLWIKEYETGREAKDNEQRILTEYEAFIINSDIIEKITSIKGGKGELFTQNVHPIPPI